MSELDYPQDLRYTAEHEWVRTGEDNRLERCKVKDASVNNWPALVEAVKGNIIADFPVINKSFNLSYSGNDR